MYDATKRSHIHMLSGAGLSMCDLSVDIRH